MKSEAKSSTESEDMGGGVRSWQREKMKWQLGVWEGEEACHSDSFHILLKLICYSHLEFYHLNV